MKRILLILIILILLDAFAISYLTLHYENAIVYDQNMKNNVAWYA